LASSAFPTTLTTIGTSNIAFAFVGYYQVTAPGNYYLAQLSNTSNVYNLVTSLGATVNDPGTNNTQIVKIQWNGTDSFPFLRSANSGYQQILYNVVGLYAGSSVTSYLIKQSVVNNAPSTVYTLIDKSGNTLIGSNGSPVTVSWSGGTFPALLPAIGNSSNNYVVTGYYSVLRSTFKILALANPNGSYPLVNLNGDIVLDEGTNGTSRVDVRAPISATYPTVLLSESGYTAINYYVVGGYFLPINPSIPTGATGPSAGSSGPVSSSGATGSNTYVPYTGPTGPYTGPTTTDPPISTATAATGSTVTNNIRGTVRSIIVGGYTNNYNTYSFMSVGTSLSDYRIILR
jgi:hypothetical protein